MSTAASPTARGSGISNLLPQYKLAQLLGLSNARSLPSLAPSVEIMGEMACTGRSLAITFIFMADKDLIFAGQVGSATAS